MDAAASSPGSTGIVRLLEHCESVARLTAGEPSTAKTRLDAALGHELAGRLVGALTRTLPCAAVAV